MKLHGDHASGSTRRVTATLEHLGAAYDFEQVDLFQGENRTPEFLALNPNGAIPVLVDGDSVIYEASAIMIYLAEAFGSDLLPGGSDRFLTLQWMFWAAEHFRQGPPVLFVERFVKKVQGLPEDPDAVDAAYTLTRKYCAILDAHLTGRRYVVGDKVTLADFDLAAPFTQYPRTRPPFDEFPNVMAWHQRLLDEVPAWTLTRDRVEARILEISEALGVTI
jgi:glutathione S-transferase